MKKNARPEQKPVTTIIGQDTVIGGTLTVENSVRIDGTIIGGITANGTVILSPSGKVTGNVVSENMVVAGVVEGDMWIKEKVSISDTGRVHGDITTKVLSIDEDAIFQGMSIMTREVEAPEQEKIAAAPAQNTIEDKSAKEADKEDTASEEKQSEENQSGENQSEDKQSEDKPGEDKSK
ncbi:MAG TPA: polymer-forming cytoskeletal protein [Lachnospiraceae bacterium]|jgi:cytoskeletal protein CcmA (bactofilin family)|nr:polymer-forming cytoskeletal protein [Lachnospiraceae bacterium]